MTARLAVMLASLLLALAVALGAFGAHALRARLSPEPLAVWQTAVAYHALHAVGLAVAGIVLMHRPLSTLAGIAGIFFVVGIVLFSGSLYALTLSGMRALGVVTPFGGLAFIAGWLCLAVAAWRTL